MISEMLLVLSIVILLALVIYTIVKIVVVKRNIVSVQIQINNWIIFFIILLFTMILATIAIVLKANKL